MSTQFNRINGKMGAKMEEWIGDTRYTKIMDQEPYCRSDLN